MAFILAAVKPRLMTTSLQVLLFYPNLIGYLRVIFVAIAFTFFFSEPLYCLLFYLAAFGC